MKRKPNSKENGKLPARHTAAVDLDFDMAQPWRAFERFPFFGNWPAAQRFAGGPLMPKVDIVDNGDSLTVNMDLPSVDRKDIRLNVAKDTITVSASRSEDRESKGKSYYRRERSSVGYYRSIPMPEPIRTESAEARYENGTLTVRVKKSGERRGTRVEVR